MFTLLVTLFIIKPCARKNIFEFIILICRFFELTVTMETKKSEEKWTSVRNSLLAGGMAGIIVDVVMFPLDTVKTRLQSGAGFRASGGLKGVYRGLASTSLGSVPAGASFFFAYELTKQHAPLRSDVTRNMMAAVMGETASCMIRIPFEVVKQHAQTHSKVTGSSQAFKHIINTYGISGFGRGFFSMLIREIPFSLIQMPLWELFKKRLGCYKRRALSGFESGVCGSFAGGISGFLTTPLDVAKTRIILAQKNPRVCAPFSGDAIDIKLQNKSSENPFQMMVHIARNEGLKGLFAGCAPRVLWISLGGFIFLGAYDQLKITLEAKSKLD